LAAAFSARGSVVIVLPLSTGAPLAGPDSKPADWAALDADADAPLVDVPAGAALALVLATLVSACMALRLAWPLVLLTGEGISCATRCSWRSWGGGSRHAVALWQGREDRERWKAQYGKEHSVNARRTHACEVKVQENFGPRSLL